MRLKFYLMLVVFMGCNKLTAQTKWESLTSHSKNALAYYEIRQNGKTIAIERKTGGYIIPPSRGYDEITFWSMLNDKGIEGYFIVKKDGLEGACDITGKEIIPCVYSGLLYNEQGFTGREYSGNWEELYIMLDPSGKAYIDYEKKRKKAKENAYNKWDSKAIYKFDDEKKTHRVWCGVEQVGDQYISLVTAILADNHAAPTLNIDFNVVSKTDFSGIMENLSDEGLENMLLKLEMANGETITSSGMAIYKSWLGIGFRLSTSLVSMRSNIRSLSGDISSIKYLVGQFSLYNIKSVTFKGRYTVDFSGIDTKSQLCYDFFRLADESGKLEILPN